MNCGLVLCTLNTPQHACPSCSNVLLTQALRKSLIDQLGVQIVLTLEKEAAARERAAIEAQQAVGAFPRLAADPSSASSMQQEKTHKVMSLNTKSKKITVASYRPAAPRATAPTSVPGPVEPEEHRVPAPPESVSYATAKIDPASPWVNLRQPRVWYVPMPTKNTPAAVDAVVKKSRRKKHKEASETSAGQAEGSQIRSGSDAASVGLNK